MKAKKKHTKLGWRQDRKLIATKQKEFAGWVKRLGLEFGVKLTAKEVREIIAICGDSARKVRLYLRDLSA